jgi:hypothetical protein
MHRLLTKRTGAVALALTVGLVAGTAASGIAGPGGLPADKTAIAGSSLTDLNPNEESLILSTKMAVSSPADLILGVSLECSIVTRLITDTNEQPSEALGSVDIRITIDGKNVPVQTAGSTGAGDDGEVTFCNRTYNRTVSDQDGDGTIDKEDDYIATKNANAFNWLAFNAGVEQSRGGYDDETDNNVIDVKVYARYTRTHAEPGTCIAATDVPAACSEAYVGKRTLIIEPVHAANGEQSEPTGTTPSGGGTTGGLLVP